ncbi:ABC transporter ATP-binding protein [Clostridiaceae bacterium M8S5]|nr:ABC transporter ATP-binding protein [Clostridiaceae bacterium M8S5]
MDYIILENVSYGYKQEYNVLDDVNISLKAGECTMIVGANGSGKTTFSKIISGIIKPNTGRVLIDGTDTKKMSLGEIGKKIGYLFQNPEKQIFTHTVYDELSFILKLKKLDQKLVYEEVYKKLKEFELLKLKDAFPFNLSQGEKQRLAIASILINDVKYIIMDEPTTGLDIKRKEKLSEIIDNLKNNGIGFAVISHDEDFINRHADRILAVEDREVVEYDS